jgi:hypothetical protein
MALFGDVEMSVRVECGCDDSDAVKARLKLVSSPVGHKRAEIMSCMHFCRFLSWKLAIQA